MIKVIKRLFEKDTKILKRVKTNTQKAFRTGIWRVQSV